MLRQIVKDVRKWIERERAARQTYYALDWPKANSILDALILDDAKSLAWRHRHYPWDVSDYLAVARYNWE